MSALAGKCQSMRIARLLVEVRAPLEQFEHPQRPFLYYNINRLVIAQPGAALLSVIDVRLITVGRLKDRGNTTLGIPGV